MGKYIEVVDLDHFSFGPDEEEGLVQDEERREFDCEAKQEAERWTGRADVSNPSDGRRIVLILMQIDYRTKVVCQFFNKSTCHKDKHRTFVDLK